MISASHSRRLPARTLRGPVGPALVVSHGADRFDVFHEFGYVGQIWVPETEYFVPRTIDRDGVIGCGRRIHEQWC